jgi:hypothetical protein
MGVGGESMIWLLGVINFHLHEQLSRGITCKAVYQCPTTSACCLTSVYVCVCMCVCVGGWREGWWLPVLKCKLVTANGPIRKEQR